MGDKVWVQCQKCGKLHRVKSKDASISDDDLYTEPLWCPRCRDGTKHLNCGEDDTEIYMYYNANLDSRMY
jgi:hypothetical protein